MHPRKTALAAVAALSLALAACGTTGQTGPGAGQLTGQGTGDSCVIEGPVKVGAALSLTGGAASYGASQQKGLELAAEHLAEKGGVKYELAVEDDATDPRQGITVFEQLIEKGMSVIIGPTLSNGAFQAQPIAQEEKVPVLAISNTADGITAQGNYIFRDSLTEGQVIPQTVAAAKAKYGLKKVVVMYSNDDAFTESGYKVFASALEQEGVEVADTLTFSKADTDFRPLLTEAKGHAPDAVVVSGLIEAAVPLVTQARELGIEVPIVGGNGFNNPALMKQAGPAAEGVVVGAAWNSASDNPQNTDFLTAFQEKNQAPPDQFAAQAYAGLMIIDSAVRSACNGEREGIKTGFGTIDKLPTVLGEVTINDQRDIEHEAVVQVVKDGKFAVLE
ncbi:ABC transporter substrate-binding protein [Microlunatus speluncae]|uniref:ABC transporter substrate-binding protein n=1 Tax=Microlunatus speluncae TaxID=2594267 RepID=UPI0012664963|nr:ABC transporter substrate-binding protein [Microlunatus speluncae]